MPKPPQPKKPSTTTTDRRKASLRKVQPSDPLACVACQGTGRSSTKKTCTPCRGTGKRQTFKPGSTDDVEWVPRDVAYAIGVHPAGVVTRVGMVAGPFETEVEAVEVDPIPLVDELDLGHTYVFRFNPDGTDSKLWRWNAIESMWRIYPGA